MPARGTVGNNAECGYATRLQPSTHKAQRPASAERQQDPHALHDLRGPRSEKGPFLARSSRGVFSNGCLRRFSDAWREYLAKAGSFRMHGGDILPIKSLHGCAKVQHARFSPCLIRAAVGYGERCRRCSVGHRERFRRRIQSWCWDVGCGLGTRPRDGRRLRADTRPWDCRRPRAGAASCGRAPGHGAGLSAASWTTDSGTVCHEPPFNRKNKYHAENENEPVHSDISPLLYSYRFYLLRNKYLALELTHL